MGVIGRDKDDRKAVEWTTLNGRSVCPPCLNLQYNVEFGRLMQRVADDKWWSTPNQIVPVFELKRRYGVLSNERKELRLQKMSRTLQPSGNGKCHPKAGPAPKAWTTTLWP